MPRPKTYNTRFRGRRYVLDIQNRYGDAYAALYCLLSAYSHIFLAKQKNAKDPKADIAEAEWLYKCATSLGVPIIDMTYFKLRDDVYYDLQLWKEKVENEVDIDGD